MNRNVERGFDRREIAIVLSKETKSVGKLTEVDGSLRGQPFSYSSRSARGFPRTSEAMMARTISRLVAKSRRDATCKGREGGWWPAVRGGAAGRTTGTGFGGDGGGWGLGCGRAEAGAMPMALTQAGTGAPCCTRGGWRRCWGNRRGPGPCACFRKLDIMLPSTPMISSPTQMRIPTSRTRVGYVGFGPEIGGGCGSDEGSVAAPIPARISVSAWTFLSR